MIKRLFRNLIPILAIIATTNFSFSQNSSKHIDLLSKDTRISNFKVNDLRGTPSLIKFSQENVSKRIHSRDLLTTVTSLLQLKDTPHHFRVANQLKKREDISIVKLQQYFKGVKVEHGVYNA